MRLFTTPRPKGQGLVEYALILVLIAIAVILVVTMLGGQINQVFNRIVLQLEHPGVYSGDPVSVASFSPSAARDASGWHGEYGVTVTAPTTLNGASGANVCVRFTLNGGGSKLSCGNPPSVRLSGGETGSGTACVVAVEGYTLTGGSTCAGFSY